MHLWVCNGSVFIWQRTKPSKACTRCTFCSQNAQEPKIWMDTPQRWTTHEDNYSTKWQYSGFLFSRWTSSIFWLLQGYGANHSWMRALASIRNSSRSVQRIQMWNRPNKLLLSSTVVQSIRFHQPEVTAWGTHHFAWPYLWFLSQISLWIEFYWTILGCSQISLPQLSQQANNNWRDGKPGAGMLRQHPSPSNPAVSNLFFSFGPWLKQDNHILNQKQIRQLISAVYGWICKETDGRWCCLGESEV